MKNKKDIFDLFRENEHKLEPTPSRHAWDRLERKLDARKDINQTSKYRSIAMVAAMVAVVSIASVIVLLNSSSDKDLIMASTAKQANSWEEIALEKSKNSGDDLVAFNNSVESKQVLMNEGSIDKKLVPKVNSGKSASNKIQNYKEEALAGNINLSTNSYEMHEAPLEREMLLGELTINKNTTKAEIAAKAIGSKNITYTNQPVAAKETQPVVDATAAPIVVMDEVSESQSETASISADEIAMDNTPSAKKTAPIEATNNTYFNDRMNKIDPADSQLEESVVSAYSKVAKKKKSFLKKAKRERTKISSNPMPASSIGISGDIVSSEKSSVAELSDKETNASIAHFSWLVRTWNDVKNSTKKECLVLGNKQMIFKTVGTTELIDFKLVIDQSVILLTDNLTNRSYRYLTTVGERRIFVNRNDTVMHVVEIFKEANQFTLSTYSTTAKEADVIENVVDKIELVERFFVKD